MRTLCDAVVEQITAQYIIQKTLKGTFYINRRWRPIHTAHVNGRWRASTPVDVRWRASTSVDVLIKRM